MEQVGNSIAQLDPTKAAQVLYTAAVQLQQAMELAALNKEDARDLCRAIGNMAPLYGRIMQLLGSKSGLVDEEFDGWFRNVLQQAIDGLERAKTDVYEYLRMNRLQRLSFSRQVQDTLRRTRQAVRDSEGHINTYLTAAGAHLLLQNRDQLRELNTQAQQAVSHLHTLARGDYVQRGDERAIRAVALLATAKKARDREQAMQKMLSDKVDANVLVRAGAVHALWRAIADSRVDRESALVKGLVVKLGETPEGREAFHMAFHGGEADAYWSQVMGPMRLQGHTDYVKSVYFSLAGFWVS